MVLALTHCCVLHKLGKQPAPGSA